MAKNSPEQLTVTLIRSPIGRVAAHRACVRGLGLRRMHHTVQVAATPENMGMIRTIQDMLRVEAA